MIDRDVTSLSHILTVTVVLTGITYAMKSIIPNEVSGHKLYGVIVFRNLAILFKESCTKLALLTSIVL